MQSQARAHQGTSWPPTVIMSVTTTACHGQNSGCQFIPRNNETPFHCLRQDAPVLCVASISLQRLLEQPGGFAVQPCDSDDDVFGCTWDHVRVLRLASVRRDGLRPVYRQDGPRARLPSESTLG